MRRARRLVQVRKSLGQLDDRAALEWVLKALAEQLLGLDLAMRQDSRIMEGLAADSVEV